MTYSGVGRVVPSMVTANTKASSQNAARRRVARRLSSAARAWSNEASQSDSDVWLEAGGVALIVTRWRRGSVLVGFMYARLVRAGVSGRHTAG